MLRLVQLVPGLEVSTGPGLHKVLHFPRDEPWCGGAGREACRAGARTLRLPGNPLLSPIYKFIVIKIVYIQCSPIKEDH